MRLWSRIRDWPSLEAIARSDFPVDRYLCYSGKLGQPPETQTHGHTGGV